MATMGLAPLMTVVLGFIMGIGKPPRLYFGHRTAKLAVVLDTRRPSLMTAILDLYRGHRKAFWVLCWV